MSIVSPKIYSTRSSHYFDSDEQRHDSEEEDHAQPVSAEGHHQSAAHCSQADQGYKKKTADPEQQISVVVFFSHCSKGTQYSRCPVVSYLAYIEHVSYQGHFEYCVPSLNFSLNRLR